MGTGAEDGPGRDALPARHLPGPIHDRPPHVLPQGHGAIPGAGAEPAAELSRRPPPEPRPRRPRQVRRLLHVLDRLPGPLHRHRRRPVALAGPREIPGDVRHRRVAVHLLRHVRGGLPGRRDRTHVALRPHWTLPRGDDVRQGEAAVRVRPDGARAGHEGPDSQPPRPVERGQRTSDRLMILADVNPVALRSLGPIALAAGLGMAALYILLPRPKPMPRLLGAALGAAGLVAAALFLTRTAGPHVETILFYAFAGLAIVGGAAMIAQHNPARAAIAF